MRKLMITACAVLLAVGISGCYHATVDTGLAPSGQTVSNAWAHGFLLGLVPPSAVHTAAQCPHGVARVETRLSFLNQLVNGVTWGIYSPMTIEVQCAALRTASDHGSGGGVFRINAADESAAQEIMTQAARHSLQTGKSALLLFD
jgi:hypothetical protein